MANVNTYLKKIEFIIDDEQTHCNIYMTSDEPENPFWGNGWRTKSFPASKTAVDIINHEMENYLEWSQGRNKYKYD